MIEFQESYNLFIILSLLSLENNFRMQLVELDKLQSTITTDNSAKSVMLHREREKISALESKVVIYENTIDEMNKMLRDRDELIATLQAEVNENRNLVNRKELEKEKQRQKYATKFAVENEKKNRELENKLREQQLKLNDQMRMKDEKIRQMRHILNDENMPANHRTQDAEFHGDDLEPKVHPSSVYFTPRPKVRRDLLRFLVDKF